MTRTELIKNISASTEMAQEDVTKVLDALEYVCLDNMMNAGEKVPVIRGLYLTNRVRNASTRRNPRTGEPVDVPARRVPVAKFTNRIKEYAVDVD